MIQKWCSSNQKKCSPPQVGHTTEPMFFGLCVVGSREYLVTCPGSDYYRLHSKEMGKVLLSQVSVSSHFGRGGYPILPDRGRGYPILPGGYPHPRSGQGWCPQSEQHSMYLLRGGRYASCIHAGGLSYIYDTFGLLPSKSVKIPAH